MTKNRIHFSHLMKTLNFLIGTPTNFIYAFNVAKYSLKLYNYRLLKKYMS